MQFSNVAKSSQLGLLSYRKFIPANAGDNRFYNPTYANGSLACYIDSQDMLHIQQDNQFLWIEDVSGTQPIYNSGATFDSTELGQVLYSQKYNIGLTGSTIANPDGTYPSASINVFSEIDWTGGTTPSVDYVDFPVTVHPYIENINNYVYSDKGGVKLINPSTKFTLPIKIFFKLSSGSTDTVTFPSNISSSPSVNRKLRFFLEPENLSRPFEFEIIFKIYKNRTYNVRSSNRTNTASGAGSNYMY